MLDKIDPWLELGRIADFIPEFAGATVNENSPRELAYVLADLRHVGAELSEVIERRGVLFALYDNRGPEFVDEQNIHSRFPTSSSLAGLLERMGEKAVLQAVRICGDVAGKRSLVVEICPKSHPIGRIGQDAL